MPLHVFTALRVGVCEIDIFKASFLYSHPAPTRDEIRLRIVLSKRASKDTVFSQMRAL